MLSDLQLHSLCGRGADRHGSVIRGLLSCNLSRARRTRTDAMLRAIRSTHMDGSSPQIHLLAWLKLLASKKLTEQNRRQSSAAQSVQSGAAGWLFSAAARRPLVCDCSHRGWFNNLG